MGGILNEGCPPAKRRRDRDKRIDSLRVTSYDGLRCIEKEHPEHREPVRGAEQTTRCSGRGSDISPCDMKDEGLCGTGARFVSVVPLSLNLKRKS